MGDTRAVNKLRNIICKEGNAIYRIFEFISSYTISLKKVKTSIRRVFHMLNSFRNKLLLK
jgi:hypothetical protein